MNSHPAKGTYGIGAIFGVYRSLAKMPQQQQGLKHWMPYKYLLFWNELLFFALQCHHCRSEPMLVLWNRLWEWTCECLFGFSIATGQLTGWGLITQTAAVHTEHHSWQKQKAERVGFDYQSKVLHWHISYLFVHKCAFKTATESFRYSPLSLLLYKSA